MLHFIELSDLESFIVVENDDLIEATYGVEAVLRDIPNVG